MLSRLFSRSPKPALAMPPRNEAAAEEKRRREEEKKAFKAAQELDSLKRCFKRIDKNNDGSIDVPELMQEVREDQQNSIAKQLAWHSPCEALRAFPSLVSFFICFSSPFPLL